MLVFLYNCIAHKHLEYQMQSVEIYSSDVLPEGNTCIPYIIFFFFFFRNPVLANEILPERQEF